MYEAVNLSNTLVFKVNGEFKEFSNIHQLTDFLYHTATNDQEKLIVECVNQGTGFDVHTIIYEAIAKAVEKNYQDPNQKVDAVKGMAKFFGIKPKGVEQATSNPSRTTEYPAYIPNKPVHFPVVPPANNKNGQLTPPSTISL
jgi:hypothetical protein